MPSPKDIDPPSIDFSGVYGYVCFRPNLLDHHQTLGRSRSTRTTHMLWSQQFARHAAIKHTASLCTTAPGKVSGFWSRLFSDHFLQVADVYIFTIRKRWSLLMILERSTKLPSLSDSNTYYTIIYIIYIYTWNPNDPRFDWKKPCFGRAKAKNRGQTGSRYIHKYTHYIIIYRDTMYTPHSGSVFHMCYWRDSVGWPFLWAWRGETEDLFPALRWY